MKFGTATSLTIAGFTLAIGIAVTAYFLFYSKKSRTPLEAARHTNVKTSAPNKPVNDTAFENSANLEEEVDSEEQNTSPIPFVVRTDSVTNLGNSIQIISKSYHLPTQPDCDAFSFRWEEVQLPNKKVTAQLNKAIREEVNSLEGNGENAGPGKIPSEFCNGEGEYEFNGTLTLLGNLLHATYYQFIFYRGAAHPGSYLETTCFDIRTGKKVNFHQLIKPNRIAELDSMVVTQPATQEDGKVRGDLSAAFRQQLSDLDFELSDKGLVVIVKGVNYVTTRLTLDLDMKETAYFLKPEIYKMVYQDNNSFSR